MSEVGIFLKKAREKRDMTQDEVKRNVVSRTTLSKIENNFIQPRIDSLVGLLENLNFSLQDYERHLSSNQIYRQHYRLVLQLKNDGLDYTDQVKLKRFIDKNKDRSFKYFNLYLTASTLLHIKNPETFNPIPEKERQKLVHYLLQINTFHSLNDLKLFANFMNECLDYLTAKKIFKSLAHFDPLDYPHDDMNYRHEIHHIFNNMTNYALQERDLEFANEVIDQHSEFLHIHHDYKYALLLDSVKICLAYLETNNKLLLTELLTIKELCLYVNDPQTAAAVEYHYLTYTHDQQYISSNCITYN